MHAKILGALLLLTASIAVSAKHPNEVSYEDILDNDSLNKKLKLTHDATSLQEPEPNPQALYDNFILFCDAGIDRIVQMDTAAPSNYRFINVVGGLATPVAIDFDPIENRIYWTDVSYRQVRRAFINGTDTQILVRMPRGTPDGLAVDFVTGLVYYTDTGTDTINVMKLDGRDRRVVIRTDLDQPRAIVLDPIAGYMYWTDWGSDARIERASMDGTGRRTLVTNQMTWPNGLAIDFQDRFMYWCDASLDRFERTDLLGNGRTLIFRNIRSHCFDLVLDESYMYYTDWFYRRPFRARKTDGIRSTFGPRRFQRLMGITLYNEEFMRNQTGSGNNCSNEWNGGCTYLCFPTPEGRTCACPDGVACLPERLCPRPDTIDNGGFRLTNRFRQGSVLTYFCNLPYELVGNSTLMCGQDGRWAGEVPSCRMGSVPVTPTPESGNFSETCKCNFKLEINGTSLPGAHVWQHREYKYEYATVNCDGCRRLLNDCPKKCDEDARNFWGEEGMYKLVQVNATVGPRDRFLGQLMCENYLGRIRPPGSRILIFYDPGKCGREISTYASRRSLCCLEFDIPEVGFVIVWDHECDEDIGPDYLAEIAGVDVSVAQIAIAKQKAGD